MNICEKLSTLLGPSAVLTEAHDTEAFTEDWRGRYRGEAACVVLPSTTEQVATVVRLCNEHSVPVIPQGGNTSLCGGAVPGSGTKPVVLSLNRMRKIRSIDPANNSMVVDAGCVLATVHGAAADAGRLYPVSLGAEGSCQIGGTIATNAGGTGVLRWGNTRENVLGLEVVLPNGEIWDGLFALRKNNTGIDLKHIFIGAEGTMGIITGASLKLHPLPTSHALAWLALESPKAAVELLGRCQAKSGSRLSAFEMMNEHQLSLVLHHVPNRKNPLAAPSPWHVLVELADTGNSEGLLAELQELLEQAFESELITDAVISYTESQRAALWEIRHSVSEANKKAGIGLTTDCAVPVSAVPAFIDLSMRAVRTLLADTPVAVVAHLGDGNAHFIPFYSFEQWNGLPDREAAGRHMRHAVNEVAHLLRGTFSAEHGIGQTQLSEMTSYKSKTELNLMRALKAAVDPHNLFNPGRLVPSAAV